MQHLHLCLSVFLATERGQSFAGENPADWEKESGRFWLWRSFCWILRGHHSGKELADFIKCFSILAPFLLFWIKHLFAFFLNLLCLLYHNIFFSSFVWSASKPYLKKPKKSAGNCLSTSGRFVSESCWRFWRGENLFLL